jgi:hypothetical protein
MFKREQVLIFACIVKTNIYLQAKAIIRVFYVYIFLILILIFGSKLIKKHKNEKYTKCIRHLTYIPAVRI